MIVRKGRMGGLIVDDRSYRGFGLGDDAQPWAYQPTEPGTYVRADAPSAEQYTAPVTDSYHADPYPGGATYPARDPAVQYDQPSASTPTSSAGSTTDVGSVIGSIAGGILKIFSSSTTPQRPPAPPPKPKIPTWVLPVAVTGGAAVLLVVLMSLGGKKRSLSGYGRRSRR